MLCLAALTLAGQKHWTVSSRSGKERLRSFAPNAKVVLVGCKLDMRTDLATLRELSKQRLIPVTHEQVRPLYLQLNSNLDLTPISGFFGS